MTSTSAVTRVLGRDTPTERIPQEPREWSQLALLAPVGLAAVVLGLLAAGRDGFSAGELVGAPLAAGWVLAGAVVVVRPGLRRLGVLLMGAGGLAGLTYLACAVATTQDAGTTRDLAILGRALGIGLLPSAALLFLLALPAGRLGTRSRRTTALIGGLIGLGVGVVIWAARPDVPAAIIWVWSLVAVGLGIPAANQRYLQASGVERQRLQWMGCAAAVALEIALVVATLRLFADWPHRAGLVAALGTLLVPAGVALGAWRRLAARADRLLVHTVSLTGLTAVVVAVYLLIVVGLGRVPTDTERQLLVLSMAAAGVSALVYSPTRDRLREVANRLVYGEREPPDAVLRTFGSRLSRAVPMDELLLQLVESLRKTMTLRAAEVWTGANGRLDRAVSVPERPAAAIQLDDTQLPVVARAGVSGNAWAAVWLESVLAARPDSLMRVVPVAHSGELLGLIVAERPTDGELFAAEEDRVLTELARQVGLALHNVELDSALQQSLEELRHTAEELRVSRARIVATADAERRKIERDLHDGAQQHLVALAVNLRLVKDVMADDPATAAEMVDQLADSVKETVQELRDLAHGIYPPLLVDKGLGEALRAAAGRSPLDVRVDTDVGRYPAEVEAAVYFCCLEALQNAAKHAPEATVSVAVHQADGTLSFEVSDDGPGFDVTTATAGHGYVNMSDRLGAIGGAVTWRSQPGEGAVIRGTVPVGADEDAQSSEPSLS